MNVEPRTSADLKDEERYRLLRAALRSAWNAVIITDRDGVIVWANPAFSRLSGYEIDEVLGRDTRTLRSGKHDEAFFERMWSTILAGKVWEGEVINRRKDGELYTEEMTIAPVPDETGEITHFVAVKQDIGARKRLEAQLRQAQRMEAVGQLAGGIAHDFNNLLTGINGYTQLVLSRVPEGSQEALDLEQVRQITRRAAELIRQLLAFSRLQSMEMRSVDLGGLIEASSKMLGRLIGADIEMEIRTAEDLGAIYADPGQIEQILFNLVINARDAMPTGGKVVVTAGNVELDEAAATGFPDLSPGAYVQMVISDTGHGMDEDTRRQIFDPFFTTKDVGEGTGLGLAAVYGIVKQHDGHIRVRSEPGAGAAFEILLPRLEEEGREEPKARTTLNGSETVLLVEDEESVRTVAKRGLEMLGYRVLAAATPREAEELFSRHRDEIDVLLTDVVMPQMDGPTLHRKLARERNSLKTLYMSGYTERAVSRNRVLEPGTPFIQKPFTPLQLAERLRQVLDTV